MLAAKHPGSLTLNTPEVPKRSAVTPSSKPPRPGVIPPGQKPAPRDEHFRVRAV